MRRIEEKQIFCLHCVLIDAVKKHVSNGDTCLRDAIKHATLALAELIANIHPDDRSKWLGAAIASLPDMILDAAHHLERDEDDPEDEDAAKETVQPRLQ